MKLKALSLITFAVVGFSTSFAFANCGDKFVADCETFKVLSTVCPEYNGDGVLSGFGETYSAVIDLPGESGMLEFVPAQMHQRASGKAFRAIKNETTQVYLMLDANVFSTWTLSEGKVSPVTQCRAL